MHLDAKDGVAAYLYGGIGGVERGDTATVERTRCRGVVAQPATEIVQSIGYGLRVGVEIERRETRHTTDRQRRWTPVANFRAAVAEVAVGQNLHVGARRRVRREVEISIVGRTVADSRLGFDHQEEAGAEDAAEDGPPCVILLGRDDHLIVGGGDAEVGDHRTR